MDDRIAALRSRFDAFSRRLNAALHEFKATGRLEAGSEPAIRNRQRAVKIKLDRAIRVDDVPEILRLALERDFEGLVCEFAHLEEEFDAALMKDAKAES